MTCCVASLIHHHVMAYGSTIFIHYKEVVLSTNIYFNSTILGWHVPQNILTKTICVLETVGRAIGISIQSFVCHAEAFCLLCLANHSSLLSSAMAWNQRIKKALKINFVTNVSYQPKLIVWSIQTLSSNEFPLGSTLHSSLKASSPTKHISWVSLKTWMYILLWKNT